MLWLHYKGYPIHRGMRVVWRVSLVAVLLGLVLFAIHNPLRSRVRSYVARYRLKHIDWPSSMVVLELGPENDVVVPAGRDIVCYRSRGIVAWGRTAAEVIAALVPDQLEAKEGSLPVVYAGKLAVHGGEEKWIVAGPSISAGPTPTLSLHWMDIRIVMDFGGKLGRGRGLFEICRVENMRRGMLQGRVRLYAGQRDAQDTSHVTVAYDVAGLPGVIDGRLVDEDGSIYMEWRVRDGPLAEETELLKQ